MGFGFQAICGRGNFLQLDRWWRVWTSCFFFCLDPGSLPYPPCFPPWLCARTLSRLCSRTFQLLLNLFQTSAWTSLLPWVGVQDTFGHIGTPKLVLALVIFAVLKYSIIRCISVKVVDSVAPKLLLILGCDFFPTKLGQSAIWSLVIRLYTIKRQFQAMHNLKSESSVPVFSLHIFSH
jgi:hypothetical protein